MELSVYNIKGEDTGKKVTLNDAIFGIEPNDHAIYLDVKQYMANQRQGTHKAKQRSELSGSTRKLGRQKGGGGARVFGPVPRDYSFKLNKKVKQLARKSAFSYKAAEGKIVLLDEISFEAPKTKDYLAMLKNLKVADKKLLIILSDQNKNVYLSARNIEGSKVVTINELNTYTILDASTLILTEAALAGIEQHFKA